MTGDGAPPQSAAPRAPSPPTAVLVVVGDQDDRPPGLPPASHPARFTFAWDLPGARRLLPDAEVVYLWSFRGGLLQRAWPAATRLRWAHVAGAGLDSTIFPELVSSDVVLTNSRGVLDVAMAEYAIALILAAAKDLPNTIALQARRAGALGMEVTAVGRRPRGGDADFKRIAGPQGLSDAVAEADYVVLTPHMAGDTTESQLALVELFLRNLDRWLRGEPLSNVVDKRLGFVPS